jgi:hypothetical protein
LESFFHEHMSDPVAGWAALRPDPADWPAWVRARNASAASERPTCAPSAEASFTCAATLLPGLTLHWAVLPGGAVLQGLLRLEGQPAAAWLAVGVAADAAGSMVGGWAVLGEPLEPASARAVHLGGKDRSLITDDATGARLRSASVSHEGGATELRFEANLGSEATDFKGADLPTTIIAAHGDGPALANHGQRKAHAVLHLQAEPSAAGAADEVSSWHATGEADYNPCAGGQ